MPTSAGDVLSVEMLVKELQVLLSKRVISNNSQGKARLAAIVLLLLWTVTVS